MGRNGKNVVGAGAERNNNNIVGNLSLTYSVYHIRHISYGTYRMTNKQT